MPLPAAQAPPGTTKGVAPHPSGQHQIAFRLTSLAISSRMSPPAAAEATAAPKPNLEDLELCSTGATLYCIAHPISGPLVTTSTTASLG